MFYPRKRGGHVKNVRLLQTKGPRYRSGWSSNSVICGNIYNRPRHCTCNSLEDAVRRLITSVREIIKENLMSHDKSFFWSNGELLFWPDQIVMDHCRPCQQISRNIDIIAKAYTIAKTARGRLQKSERLQLRRGMFAAYRLFRWNDLDPLEITSLLGRCHGIYMYESLIKQWIGEAFREACIIDDQCVFKPYLFADARPDLKTGRPAGAQSATSPAHQRTPLQ
jgi:hypothetical protein